MEIERKYLIKELPEHLEDYPRDIIRQAYISTEPVIRIRQKSDSYILTVKSSGLLARQEVEFPLTEENFSYLLTKTQGLVIEKIRYRIPDRDDLTIELDIFQGAYDGFIMAEVEFPDLESANGYIPPSWFGTEVTEDTEFHNSVLSMRTPEQVRTFMEGLKGYKGQ